MKFLYTLLLSSTFAAPTVQAGEPSSDLGVRSESLEEIANYIKLPTTEFAKRLGLSIDGEDSSIYRRSPDPIFYVKKGGSLEYSPWAPSF